MLLLLMEDKPFKVFPAFEIWEEFCSLFEDDGFFIQKFVRFVDGYEPTDEDLYGTLDDSLDKPNPADFIYYLWSSIDSFNEILSEKIRQNQENLKHFDWLLSQIQGSLQFNTDITNKYLQDALNELRELYSENMVPVYYSPFPEVIITSDINNQDLEKFSHSNHFPKELFGKLRIANAFYSLHERGELRVIGIKIIPFNDSSFTLLFELEMSKRNDLISEQYSKSIRINGDSLSLLKEGLTYKVGFHDNSFNVRASSSRANWLKTLFARFPSEVKMSELVSGYSGKKVGTKRKESIKKNLESLSKELSQISDNKVSIKLTTQAALLVAK